jgi:hypothetical protein
MWESRSRVVVLSSTHFRIERFDYTFWALPICALDTELSFQVLVRQVIANHSSFIKLLSK